MSPFFVGALNLNGGCRMSLFVSVASQSRSLPAVAFAKAGPYPPQLARLWRAVAKADQSA